MQKIENSQLPFQSIGLEFDLHSILKDILREWWAILLIALSVGMITNVLTTERYQASYTTRATLFVTAKGTKNTVYNNVFSAEESAGKFSQILNSNILQKKVAQEIGLEAFSGTASASAIEETNLLEVQVVSSTPELSFRQMQSILKNYGQVSEYLLGNAILEVLQEPEVPMGPDMVLNTRIQVEKNVILTILILCMILAVFSFLRDTIRTDRDIDRKLDTKRLASVSHENKYKTLRSRFRKVKTSILITDPTISFRYVETMKKLSRKVKNRMDERGIKSVLLTSVLENEGKSTVAANLALALSQESKRVLLIDCDFRHPSQYKVLGLQNMKFDDLGNILNGKAEIKNLIGKVPGTELYYVLNTVAFPNSTEMITSGLLKKVIAYFEDRMDYIILDTSPMALVADAEEMAGMVDASILVIKQHVVEAKDLNDAIDVLNAGDSRLLGCVFNDIHVGVAEHGRAYGYGYGYGYGGHYEQ